MANEIQVTAIMTFAKGTVTAHTFSAASGLSRDVAGSKYIRNVQAVGTDEEALNLGDVASTGALCLMKNLDATNFISVKAATGVAATVKLLPGDVAMLRFAGAAPFVQADTAPCNLEYYLVEA
jgi:hypothetical protein